MNLYHNSRDIRYRSPLGAVETNTHITIKIKVTANYVSSVKLRLWMDETEHLLDMHGEGGDIYSAGFDAPSVPMLIWYGFKVEADGETLFYSNADDGLGGEGSIVGEILKSYQITVCEHGFKTPDWFKNSIMYQIFPDRFFGVHSGAPVKKREEYVIHGDWYDPLAFDDHPYEYGPACNDFYGGNLAGIIAKLPYLHDLGISVIYLNPIFDAYSNHKYDTADYMRIDPMFGDEKDFSKLCAEAKKLGIKIILDGVFSHTGSDSVYFNKYGKYGEHSGAYRDPNSPYRSWYNLHGDGGYDSWWGCSNLPNVNEMNDSYLDFILRGENSVVKKWLRLGASGWRLDVADELPDEFIEILRREVKSVKPDAVIIGEVWEDASNKIAYGKQRKYFFGKELDGVMNYVLKDSFIGFLLKNFDAETLDRRVMSLVENYPAEALYSLMNIVGTHDTKRIKTVLGELGGEENMSRDEKAAARLSAPQETLAIKRVKLISFMQMTFFGVPCIYYGDEIGMQGLSDPHNRMPYTWRVVDPDLREHYRSLAKLRNTSPALRTGGFKTLRASSDVFVYERTISGGKDALGSPAKDETIVCAVNRGDNEARFTVDCEHIRLGVHLPPYGFKLYKLENGEFKSEF